MNALILIFMAILFIVGFMAGKNQEIERTMEMRKSVKESWLQDCTKPIVIKERENK